MRDLEPAHTAIVLHWCGTALIPDRTFIIEGIVQGEELHRLIDVLLDEHLMKGERAQIETEITLFWHHPDGHWDTQDYLSTYAV